MTDARAELGQRIRELRQAAGLKLKDVPDRLFEAGLPRKYSVQHLSSVELGNCWPSPTLARALDEVLGANGELIRRLRLAKVPPPSSDGDSILVTGHLFYPLFVEAPLQPEIAHHPAEHDFVPRLGSTSRGESASLHSFPFQVVVLHEVHTLAVDDLSDVAVWREEQMLRKTTAAQQQLEALGHRAEILDHDPYCFTAFVIDEVPWSGEHLRRRATHILAMPGALIVDEGEESPQDRAEGLLLSGSPIDDVVDFSHTGSHFGAASWAAVAVTPHNDGTLIRHLLVTHELQLQAIWCYANNVETRGAFIDHEYSKAFLGRVLQKLQRPGATEHTQVRRLREALVQTSRIAHVIRCALNVAGE